MTRPDWAGFGTAGSMAARVWTFAFLAILVSWVVVVLVLELVD